MGIGGIVEIRRSRCKHQSIGTHLAVNSIDPSKLIDDIVAGSGKDRVVPITSCNRVVAVVCKNRICARTPRKRKGTITPIDKETLRLKMKVQNAARILGIDDFHIDELGITGAVQIGEEGPTQHQAIRAGTAIDNIPTHKTMDRVIAVSSIDRVAASIPRDSITVTAGHNRIRPRAPCERQGSITPGDSEAFGLVGQAKGATCTRGIDGFYIDELGITGAVQIREGGASQHQSIRARTTVNCIHPNKLIDGIGAPTSIDGVIAGVPGDVVYLIGSGDGIVPCTASDRQTFALVHQSQCDTSNRYQPNLLHTYELSIGGTVEIRRGSGKHQGICTCPAIDGIRPDKAVDRVSATSGIDRVVVTAGCNRIRPLPPRDIDGIKAVAIEGQAFGLIGQDEGAGEKVDDFHIRQPGIASAVQICGGTVVQHQGVCARASIEGGRRPNKTIDRVVAAASVDDVVAAAPGNDVHLIGGSDVIVPRTANNRCKGFVLVAEIERDTACRQPNVFHVH